MFRSKPNDDDDDKKSQKLLKEFINHRPQANYTFDSKRNSPESEICRKGSQDCVMIRMNSKRLFEAMQDLGFFCALPIDPERTHMECKPLPK